MVDTTLLLCGRDILVGGAIGVAIGLTGIGGGALIQPSLLYIKGPLVVIISLTYKGAFLISQIVETSSLQAGPGRIV
jgi:uncharacterized membrane protein YfcA